MPDVGNKKTMLIGGIRGDANTRATLATDRPTIGAVHTQSHMVGICVDQSIVLCVAPVLVMDMSPCRIRSLLTPLDLDEDFQ